MTTRTIGLVRRVSVFWIISGWFILLFCPVASAVFGFMAGGLENRDEAKMAVLLKWWDGMKFLPDIHWWMRSSVFSGALLGMTIITLLYIFWGRRRLRELNEQAMQGRCGTCSYDLRGHIGQGGMGTAGNCPECGTGIIMQ